MDGARPVRPPHGVDLTQPSAARVYDYLLGGACNFAPDRELAREIARVVPWVDLIAKVNRDFLGRAVRLMVASGVRQFLDLGSGVPTVGNVHEIAQAEAPDCRVVYVDLDPVAVTHSELRLVDNPGAVAIRADARDPDGVLNHPDTRALIDFDEPVGLLMVALLHFLADDDLDCVIKNYRDALAPGSMFALSHLTDDVHTERVRALAELCRRHANPITTRSRDEIARLLGPFELVPPGLEWAVAWRPEFPENVGPHPESCALYAAVGRVT